MADFNYDMFSLGTAAKDKLREVSQEGSVSTGIGAKPVDEQEPMDTGFYESMYDAIMTYFDDAEDADRVLKEEKPDRDAIRSMTLSEFDNITLRSAEEAGVLRQDMGKTEAAVPEERKETRLVDVTDTELGKLDNVKPLEELAEDIDPGTIDTEPLDADGVQPTDGKGLMSPTTEEVTKTVTDLVYDDFVGDKQEGDEAHVGQDNKNITLAGGVVPDGLKYDGKDFTQGSSEVVGFDKTKLDTSNAYKKVGNVTVKRSDFDSDKAFAKGVIEEFKNQAEAAAGTNWDKMSEGSKKAVIKIGWNKGTGWYTGKSAKAIYAELAKEEPDPSNLYSKILVGSTVKGGGASIGIAKARANAWNETISATGGKEIVKIEADNSGNNTAFKYYDKDGNLLHTEQTNRASTIYENKGRDSISKNSEGAW